MLVRWACRFSCLMKYSPTQSAMALNPFRNALSAGRKFQRPANCAEAWCTYSSHSRNEIAVALNATIAPKIARGLVRPCSMESLEHTKQRADFESIRTSVIKLD